MAKGKSESAKGARRAASKTRQTPFSETERVDSVSNLGGRGRRFLVSIEDDPRRRREEEEEGGGGGAPL